MKDPSKPWTDWIGSQEVREEIISEFPAQAAAAMLEVDGEPMSRGNPLPPLWHWFYFLPRVARSQVDHDGHPKRGGFLPPVDLPRRMFAGARTRIFEPITIGETAIRQGEILKVTEKSGKSGRLVFVTVNYRIRQGGTIRVEEEQDIVYKEPGPSVPAPRPLPSVPNAPAGSWIKNVTPDTVLLFRFSALTFNAHRIHYDRPYAINEEGYPGLVVHGPLTAILLAGIARENSSKQIVRFRFQGLAPLFDLHPFMLVGQPEGDTVVLDAYGPDGKNAMHANAALGCLVTKRMLMSEKTNPGNYFEDFRIGMIIVHATPRTVTDGDVSLYTALYGSRFPVQSSSAFARAIGLPEAPLDDMLLFHMVFGKTVPDISLNAVANLGYASGRFHVPAFPGDTISTVSEVIGLKENSNGKTGTVYVRSIGSNQRKDTVLEYIRWVMVRKKDAGSPAPEAVVPELPKVVAVAELSVPDGLNLSSYDTDLAGSTFLWEDYGVGERIDHVDAMTVEESDHMIATRLYQNTAKVHFNQHAEKDGRFGRRIVYGGHIISLARSFSFNGLANAFKIAAINGGRHVAPIFAGDTVYAWSEILSKDEMPDRSDLGVLRLRLVATRDKNCASFPYKNNEGGYDPAVVLDFDYTVLMPRRRR